LCLTHHILACACWYISICKVFCSCVYAVLRICNPNMCVSKSTSIVRWYLYFIITCVWCAYELTSVRAIGILPLCKCNLNMCESKSTYLFVGTYTLSQHVLVCAYVSISTCKVFCGCVPVCASTACIGVRMCLHQCMQGVLQLVYMRAHPGCKTVCAARSPVYMHMHWLAME